MVCLDTPTSRATSSAFRPASTCFNAAMMSASVCLPLDMLLPLSDLRNHIQFRADLGEQVKSERDQDAYLALARAFCDGPCQDGVSECIRTCDQKIDRFRESSGEFGVLMPDRSMILTFHILYPFGTAGVPVNRTHPFATN